MGVLYCCYSALIYTVTLIWLQSNVYMVDPLWKGSGNGVEGRTKGRGLPGLRRVRLLFVTYGVLPYSVAEGRRDTLKVWYQTSLVLDHVSKSTLFSHQT